MSPDRNFLDRYLHRLDRCEPFVVVTIVEAHGSVPQDVGAKMVVTEAGLDYGTIGGGKVEAKALELAGNMLRESTSHLFVDWNLKADVGMTCGGSVKLYFERVGAKDWPIFVFGAGHISQALANILVLLPCRLTCIDPRKEWLDKLPSEVTSVHLEETSKYVDKLPENAFVLCMTRGHSSDYPVLKRIFSADRKFAYLGVIGSRAKAAVLKKELIAAGIPEARIQFQCPIGLPLGGNHPSEIAVSITAQLLLVRDVNHQRSTAPATIR
jgi:xanthine dehydrogenase accessory factor